MKNFVKIISLLLVIIMVAMTFVACSDGADGVDGQNGVGDMLIDSSYVNSYHGAIAAFGNTVINNANVTLNGAGGSSHIFYVGNSGDTPTTITVNGGNYIHKGNIDGSIAYIMSNTTMEINDGYFTASNGGYGMATYPGSLIVNGGTFDNRFENWGGPITVTGGSFKVNPSSYIAEGYTSAKNAEGYWVVTEIAE